ncbi:very short patch repair endonuclease [Dysgonomonas capnocytophagoides]|uniref:very short patch repair endonuclease n=1 Tax=Dysgonomonas capnocytophagoides TaxID=45254 RepID=UPI002920835D|nr:very short patch repair endonuclease [Dysgonomonas capnocytophagoides]
MANFVFDTTPERSCLMKKIKSNNTKPEIKLRKALWATGIRYRLNVTKLPGKPDIVIQRYKLIIFVDGEFWHGYRWEEKKVKIKANRDYWIKKIERNMQRDIHNIQLLQNLGYTVIRFWEHEIKEDIQSCINRTLLIIEDNE